MRIAALALVLSACIPPPPWTPYEPARRANPADVETTMVAASQVMVEVGDSPTVLPGSVYSEWSDLQRHDGKLMAIGRFAVTVTKDEILVDIQCRRIKPRSTCGQERPDGWTEVVARLADLIVDRASGKPIPIRLPKVNAEPDGRSCFSRAVPGGTSTICRDNMAACAKERARYELDRLTECTVKQ